MISFGGKIGGLFILKSYLYFWVVLNKADFLPAVLRAIEFFACLCFKEFRGENYYYAAEIAMAEAYLLDLKFVAETSFYLEL